MRNPLVFFGVFAAIGIPCFLLALFFTFSTVQRTTSWEQADGKIVALSSDGFPTVSFSYQGKDYTFSSSYSSGGMTEGDPVIVYFPSGNPDEAILKSFFSLWFLPLFLGLFGLIFGGVGVAGFLVQRRKAGAKKELFTEGRGKKISAPISGVNVNSSYAVNGVHPYVIRAQWLEPATQLMFSFESEYIWYNPSQFLDGRTNVDVYIDEQDPKRYYMDTTFLPKSMGR